MYWSSVQQLVHHASTGCAMNVGDLLGSAPSPARRRTSAAACWKSAGTAPSRSSSRAASADVSRRRRFARLARLVPGRRLSRRVRRGRRDDRGGGVVPSRLIPSLRGAHSPHRRHSGWCEASTRSIRSRSRPRDGITALPAHIPDPRRMRGDVVGLYLRCTRLSDGGCFATDTPGPPFPRRADRPRRKTAAAVRADIVQPGLDAVRAERAFVGADPRFRRIRRQVLVAIFAVRPELQRHGRPVSLSRDDHRKSAAGFE